MLEQNHVDEEKLSQRREEDDTWETPNNRYAMDIYHKSTNDAHKTM